MKIKQVKFRKYERKTGDYTKIVEPFSAYTITRDETSEKGFRTIEISGPKQTFTLCSTAKPLKVLFPPVNDGDSATVKELPFFFVMGKRKYNFPSVTKIQGASNFALDGDVLIPYVSSGRGLVSPMKGF